MRIRKRDPVFAAGGGRLGVDAGTVERLPAYRT